MLFVCHRKILQKDCFQILSRPFYLPRENEDNAYAKYGIVFKVNLLEHLNVYSILRHFIFFSVFFFFFAPLNLKPVKYNMINYGLIVYTSERPLFHTQAGPALGVLQ